MPSNALDEELLNLQLDGEDLGVELASLVGRNGAGNDGAGDTASATESSLRGEEDVRDVLVLAKEGKVEKDLWGEGAGGEGKRRRSVWANERVRERVVRTSMGSVSAVMTMNSQIPRLRVLVA